MRYRIIIEKGERDDGAFCPDVPGCVATGDTIEEARREMAARPGETE